MSIELDDAFFYIHSHNCPWYNDGNCIGSETYDEHSNDPKYSECNYNTCPTFFWLETYLNKLKGYK